MRCVLSFTACSGKPTSTVVGSAPGRSVNVRLRLFYDGFAAVREPIALCGLYCLMNSYCATNPSYFHRRLVVGHGDDGVAVGKWPKRERCSA